MKKLLPLVFLVLTASGCAAFLPEREEGTAIATSSCRVRELGWWDGPLTHCSWNRLVKEDRGEED